MKNKTNHPPEFIELVKNYYLDPNNNVTFQEIADNSASLFGRPISFDDIKYHSKVGGNWSLLKKLGGRKIEDIPMVEKIQAVANKLYGIMMDEDDVGELPVTQLVQVAKTWADLIDKAKLTKEVTTAKLPAQTVKDMIEKSQAQNR